MDLEHVRHTLALKSIEGIGPVAFERLTRQFGGAQGVFRQDRPILASVGGIGLKTAQRITAFREWDAVDREIDTARRRGIQLITVEDPDYPALLRHIHDRPALLYVRGTLVVEEACLAIVGSRGAGAYGKYTAERLARELAFHGVTIVSGLARGIDSAAHQGALSVGGRTIAVLGCGLDIVYPPENDKVYERIAASGAVISEYPFGTRPLAENFPIRNRIISGMSLGALVIEAKEKSGSLITAECALEQGREVFAVPGPIDYPGSRGVHELIKQGAKLVETVEDILEELVPHWTRQAVVQPPPVEATFKEKAAMPPEPVLNKCETRILEVLADAALQVDTLIESTGLASPVVLNTLLRMELKGVVRQLPGKVFRKADRMTIE